MTNTQLIETNKDLISPGLQFCEGCGMELLCRVVLKILGDDIVWFGGPSCSVLSDKIKTSYYGTLMTNVASSMTGVSRYFRRIGRDTLCVCMVGDGTTADIGFGPLSAAAERGEHVLYICYDNEAYMNTGVQRSSTTPFGTATATTPVGANGRGKTCDAKPVPILIAEHNVEYAATATLAYMEDLTGKVQKAAEAAKHGFAYLHVLASCPTGWKHEPEKAIEVTKAAVLTNYYPLWEARKGNFRFTKVVKKPQPVRVFTDYMKRFSHLTEEELASFQDFVDRRYRHIERLTRADID